MTFYEDTFTSATFTSINSGSNQWTTSAERLASTISINQGDLDNISIKFLPQSTIKYLSNGLDADDQQNLNINTAYVEIKIQETLVRKGNPIATII